MRKLIFILGMMASLHCFAGAGVSLSGGQIQADVRALFSADINNLNCGETYFSNLGYDDEEIGFLSFIENYRDYPLTLVSDILHAVSEGYLDSSGAQPAITLMNYDNVAKTSRSVFSISTSSDYKKILQITISHENFKPVNQGSIISPDFENEWVPNGIVTCN